jgi:hypothetical protein
MIRAADARMKRLETTASVLQEIMIDLARSQKSVLEALRPHGGAPLENLTFAILKSPVLCPMPIFCAKLPACMNVTAHLEGGQRLRFGHERPEIGHHLRTEQMRSSYSPTTE